jgi:hypothetical protein
MAVSSLELRTLNVSDCNSSGNIVSDSIGCVIGLRFWVCD